MSHLTPHLLWTLAPGLLASMAGAGVAIFVAIRSARRGPRPPQDPTPAFVAAALLAAMMGGLIYQGVSNNFPPDYVGAAIFLVGALIALRMGLRRRQA